MVYEPAAKSVNVDINLKFKFVSDDAAKGKWSKKDEETYRKDYMEHVVAQWNKRYTAGNVREPQAAWKDLNPVAFQVQVHDMDEGKAKGGLHFTIEVHKRDADFGKNEGANVSNGVTQLWPNHGPPAAGFNPDAKNGEVTRLRQVIPGLIKLDFNKSEVKAEYRDKLTFAATYMKRINEPRFEVEILGHASSEGAADYNLKLSQQRADAVLAILKNGGVTNHKLVASAVGEKGAKNTEDWRKVTIKVDSPGAYTNVQDVQAHEFGHMLGLGDEYAGKLSNHYDLVVKAFGKTYADQVGPRGGPGRTSIMHFGQDVRVYHYVTLWSALCELTLQKAAVPDPRFGYDDWKLNG